MGNRWSRRHPSCRGCGTVKVNHHAHGLCRSCYGVERSGRVGSWPSWLERCLACGDRDVPYRATGLCGRCHRRAVKVGVMQFWRMIFTVRRAKLASGDRSILVSVIRNVGLSATALMIDHDKRVTLEFAIGEREIDRATANAIVDAFLELSNE